MKKNIVFVCLILTMVISSTVFAFAYSARDIDRNEENLEGPSPAFEKIAEEQQTALQAYERLWNHFTKDANGDPIYPHEYAGEYIDEDGRLVVMLTDTAADILKQYDAIMGHNPAVVYQKAVHSLSYLQNLDQVAMDMRSDELAVLSFGVDRRNNSYLITVHTSSLDQAQAKLSSSMYADLPIVLDATEGLIQVSASSYK